MTGRLAGAVALREAHGADVPALARLDEELFGADAWGERTWWAELARRPRRYYVVAEEAGTGPEGSAPAIVGYAGCDLGGVSADVMTIATAPEARGRGVGDLLLARLIDEARQDGASALLLEVRADNGAALGVYGRHGFVEVSRRPRYYQPDDVDAIVMRKLLRAPEDHGETAPSREGQAR
ncbi:MAG: ribosomal protein S18-alanine N-acetyltransferase [Dermatophilaceae bacterium]